MKKAFILIVTIGCINLAWAEPKIDDNNNPTSALNGSIITIVGTGFGEKNIPEPLKWDNFENGTDGQVIAGENAFGKNNCDNCWSDYASLTSVGAEPPKYSVLNNKKGSSLCSRHHFVVGSTAGSDYSDSMLVYEGPKQLTDKVFVSFWVRWDWGNTQDDSYQQKIFRMVNEDGMQSMPGIMVNCFKKVNGLDIYNATVLYNSSSSQLNPNELKYGGVNPFGNEKWGMFQMWVKAGSSGDGKVHLRYFRVGEAQTARNWTGTTLENGYWRDFIFGLCAANVDDPHTLDTTYYFDDIYIDDSWARVEIGNNSVYDNCTHREMQIPKGVWAQNSVTFTVNQGSFNNGDKAYLFVVDGNGVASVGKQIVFGAPPEPPGAKDPAAKPSVVTF